MIPETVVAIADSIYKNTFRQRLLQYVSLSYDDGRNAVIFLQAGIINKVTGEKIIALHATGLTIKNQSVPVYFPPFIRITGNGSALRAEIHEISCTAFDIDDKRIGWLIVIDAGSVLAHKGADLCGNLAAGIGNGGLVG